MQILTLELERFNAMSVGGKRYFTLTDQGRVVVRRANARIAAAR